MLLTDAEKAGILATSKEIQGSFSEDLTRRRLDRSELPVSYEPQYGETADKTEEVWDELVLKGSLFFTPGERQLLKEFGEFVECDLLAHVAGDADVLSTDTIVARDAQYKIARLREAPLRGFIALALKLTKPTADTVTPVTVLVDAGWPDSLYPGDPIDGGVPASIYAADALDGGTP